MDRNKIFTHFYGTFEILVDVLSSVYILYYTHDFMKAYLPDIHFNPNGENHAANFLARSFGYYIFMGAIMQFAAIRYGSNSIRKWMIVALIIGDSLQIGISWLYFKNFMPWTSLIYFNFSFTPFLWLTRAYYLISGIPDNPKQK